MIHIFSDDTRSLRVTEVLFSLEHFLQSGFRVALELEHFWILMSGFRVLLPPVPYWLRAEPRSTNSEFREGCDDPQRSYGIMSNVSLLTSIPWI